MCRRPQAPGRLDHAARARMARRDWAPPGRVMSASDAVGTGLTRPRAWGLPPLAEPDSPEERELAGVLTIDRAIFAAPGVHAHLIREATEARLDRRDVIAPGVGRVGVETLILGDELREFGSEELEERLARAAPEEQHVRLCDLRAGFARPNQERTQIRLAVSQAREYRHDEQSRGDPPGGQRRHRLESEIGPGRPGLEPPRQCLG